MFGLWNHCPEDAPVAWGARAIIEGNPSYDPGASYTQRGTRRKRGVPEHKKYRHNISLLWDRQSWRGEEKDRKAFGALLNAGMITAALNKAKELLLECEMSTREPGLFTLLDTEGVRFLGNTNGSCGYLYIIAFPTEGYVPVEV